MLVRQWECYDCFLAFPRSCDMQLFQTPPPPTPTDNFPERKHASINWPLYTLLWIFILFRGYNNQVPSNHEPCGSLPRPCLNNRSTHLSFGFLDLFFLFRARTPNLFKYPKVLLRYILHVRIVTAICYLLYHLLL